MKILTTHPCWHPSHNFSTGFAINNFFALDRQSCDSTEVWIRYESDVVSNSMEWECPISSISFVCAWSQSDYLFANCDSSIRNEEFEGRFWEFDGV